MSDIYEEGRSRFRAKLRRERARVVAELADAEAEYELASCLPSLERGYEDHSILVKMGVTKSAAQLAGRIELLEAHQAALDAAITVMEAEA